MTLTDSATAQPTHFALALGTLGGAALVATTSLTSWGQAIFLPYALLILSTLVFLKFGRVTTFQRRFAMALGSFMVASGVLYLYIVTIPTDAWRLPLLGHAWRIAFLVAVGSVLSAAVAQLAAPRA